MKEENENYLFSLWNIFSISFLKFPLKWGIENSNGDNHHPISLQFIVLGSPVRQREAEPFQKIKQEIDVSQRQNENEKKYIKPRMPFSGSPYNVKENRKKGKHFIFFHSPYYRIYALKGNIVCWEWGASI